MFNNHLVLHSGYSLGFKKLLSQEAPISGLASDHPTVPILVPGKDCDVGLSVMYWFIPLVVPVTCPTSWPWLGKAADGRESVCPGIRRGETGAL